MIKILVVDDEEPLRRLLNKELTRKGFAVEVAPDGKTALSLAKQNTYDVVLLDIMMPGMDGYELARRLRQDPLYADLPILALTAQAGAEKQQAALAAGADACLVKPVEPADLKAKLDQLLLARGTAGVRASLDA